MFLKKISKSLRWSSAKSPQRTGTPFVLETVKVSVKQLPANDTAVPLAVEPEVTPNMLSPILVVIVEGPLMTKVSKSKRIWQMSSLSLHTWAPHMPEPIVENCEVVTSK